MDEGVLIGMVGCGVLAMPLTALVVAILAWRRLGRVEERVAALDEAVSVKTRALWAAVRSGAPAAPDAGAPLPERPPAPPPPIDAPPPAPQRLEEPVAAEPVATPAREGAEAGEAVPPVPRPEPEAPPPEVEVDAQAPAPAGAGLEALLGGRLLVWIGAAAAALAAALLVKMSIDRGLLTPAVRVFLGVAFGLGLVIGGEALRRSSRYVANGLSAAGIAALFFSFYAATHLYRLIPHGAGFALMGLTTATAVALSLRQGPIVASVGLVGGFLTPALLRTGEPRPALFLYLLVLQTGLVVVTYRRRWWPLAGLTLLASLGWALVYMGTAAGGRDALWIGVFLLASAATFVAAVVRRRADAAEAGETEPGLLDSRPATLLAWVSMAGSLVVAASLVRRAEYDLAEWGVLAILAAGCYVLARLRDVYHLLAWLATALVAISLASWLAAPALPEHGFSVLGAFAVAFVAGAYLAHRGSDRPGAWAALAATSGPLLLLLAYRAGTRHGLEAPWGTVALAAAVVYVLLAIPVARRRASDPGAERPLAALAAAATTLASLVVPLELERQWLTVAWALEVAALLWLRDRLRVDALRVFAVILTVGVAVRLLVNPAVFTYPTGDHPLFSWLLYGYGVPILAFAVAAERARRQDDDAMATGLEGLAIALAVVFLGLGTRQYFHPGDLDASSFPLAEHGAFTVLWGGLGVALLRLAARTPRPTLDWGGRLVVVLALAQGAFSQLLVANPAIERLWVGDTRFLNVLVWAYGGPVVVFALGATALAARGSMTLRRATSIAALVFLFAFVTLEVRQAFRGAYLTGIMTRPAEGYATSLAWILLGILLAATGLALRRKSLRLAGLAVFLPAISKVFLWDVARLGDVYRVLSLFALGASLFLVAWLYQRYLKEDDEP